MAQTKKYQNATTISHDAKITAIVGSMTTAQKALSALNRAAIHAEIINNESGSAQHGCVFGIRFSANHIGNVRMILENAHINVRRYVNANGLEL